MRQHSEHSNQHGSEQFKSDIYHHGLDSLTNMDPNISLIVWLQQKDLYTKREKYAAIKDHI